MISFVSVEETPLPQGRRKLRQWLEKIAEDYGVKGPELSYAFGPSGWMADLNMRHLGHEGDTDILTFDYGERNTGGSLALQDGLSDRATHLNPFGRVTVWGECCICPERVTKQSADWGSTPQEEMRRVMVHGLLHLIGYDDKNSEDQKQMREAEDRALAIFASL
ncbi:MAG: rRNA maturation RNase YbeY [Sphingomonadales bacterium]|nr:rRNA maturation RNase YbeY [Sphingomonadales bacterium]MBM3931357.1 rRNA maturation RNase YbeY [Sphingomonadales bacterium]